MNNIVYLSFSPKLKSVFLPSDEICECFKVDFKKKKIKAYKMLGDNKRFNEDYYIQTISQYKNIYMNPIGDLNG